MTFSICNELFEDWPWARVCEFVAAAGYDGVEVAPFTLAARVGDITSEHRIDLRRTAESAGLAIVGLHWLLVGVPDLHINHPDRQVRARTVGYLTQLVDLCGDLGGKIMVFGSPKQRNVPAGLTHEQAWGLAQETFRRILKPAARRGVTICLEPLSAQETDFINTAAEARRFVEEVGHPNLRRMRDVKAMCAEDRPLPEIIRENAAVTAHFHANDANLRGPGFGDTDFDPIAQALREVGYGGYVSVEVFDFKPDPETIATRSLAHLREKFSAS